MAYQPKSYKKFVATAATATLVATAVVPAAFASDVETAAFTDVPKSYEDAINFVVTNNISKGLTETKYGINTEITRGNAAIIIANAAGLNNPDAPSAGFTDVPTRGALAVNSLKAAGIVDGKSATKFGFEASITRGEAAIMLKRAFNLTGNVNDVKFTDVSDRYTEAVAALMANDVTNGISATKFGTQNPIKRGDFAKFIYGLKEFVVLPSEAPVVTSVSAINATTARVNFKGALPADVDFTNFDINGGLTVTNAVVSADRKSATITVNPAFTRNQEYTVSVFGVKDAEGKEYAETTGKVSWVVADGVTVALDTTTLEQDQKIGLSVKDADGKDVKDATVKVTSFNTNLVLPNSATTPGAVELTAQKLAGTTEVQVETTLPDGSVLTNTFTVTVKEAVTTVSNAGYSLEADALVAADLEFANTVAFKAYADKTTTLVENSPTNAILYAFGETNGNPDAEEIDFSEATRVVSSNPQVATAVLNASDLLEVDPIKAGTTTITVTMKDGSRKTFPVTVTAKPVLSTISVSDTYVKLSDENRLAGDTNAEGQEGVDAKTITVSSLDQFGEEISLDADTTTKTPKVTISSSTEGIKLYDAATAGTEIGNDELVFASGADSASFAIVAQKDKLVKSAKVTVNYFADQNDAKPSASKVITVDVNDVDVTKATTANLDIVTKSEIDANGTVNAINFGTAATVAGQSNSLIYALDSKGNRVELLNADSTAVSGFGVTAELDAKNTEADKYVDDASSVISFDSNAEALTYLRAASTVNVTVTADGVTKVLPITYKNTAVVPNKATVSTNAVTIKLPAPTAPATSDISFEDIIFGQVDADQVKTDDVSDATVNTGTDIISVLKTAKNGGYEYNKPLVSILGTDNKTVATGVNVYGTDLADSMNTWNNAITNGFNNTAFDASDFEVEFAVANVAGDVSVPTTGNLADVIALASGESATFTLVITGVYVTNSVVDIEGATTLATATDAQKARHNLLASPAQLNVSVSAN